RVSVPIELHGLGSLPRERAAGPLGRVIVLIAFAFLLLAPEALGCDRSLVLSPLLTLLFDVFLPRSLFASSIGDVRPRPLGSLQLLGVLGLPLVLAVDPRIVPFLFNIVEFQPRAAIFVLVVFRIALTGGQSRSGARLLLHDRFVVVP